MPRSRRRLFRLPWRSAARIRADLDDELEFHRTERVRELIAAGAPPDAAEREALREFGDLEALRRQCIAEDERAERAERRAAWLDDLRQDLVFAARSMRRSPGFGVVTALTLALGIGANTAIFSVVNRVLIEQLPYGEPRSLVRIYGHEANQPIETGQLSAADYVDMRERQRSLGAVAAFAYGELTYLGGDSPARLRVARVAANMFDVLRVRPVVGRAFLAGEDDRDAAPNVVLTYRTWMRVFGGDPAVVGRGVSFASGTRTVLGVLPPAFVWPDGEADAFIALDLSRVLANETYRRKYHFLGAVGRLRDGATAESARAEWSAIARDLAAQYPASNEGIGITLLPLRDAMVGRVRPALLILMGASALVLLIACANVAGVLLSRTVVRRPELAVRTALGASRGRIVRQLIAESVLIGGVGGALGLALAWGGTRVLGTAAAGALPQLGPIAVDARVAVFALAAALASIAAFGVAPALASARTAPFEALRDARGRTGSAARTRLRRAIVTGQMALAALLLVGAGLLVRTLLELQRVDLGFEPARVLTFQVALSGPGYATNEQEDAFFAAALARLRALPGVVSVATTGGLPLVGGSTSSLFIDGRPAANGRPPEVGYTPVSDDYFRTMRIPLLAGRPFDGRDRATATGAVILSQSAARTHWPNGDALGARIRLGPDPSQPWSVVVGIVGDVRTGSVASAPRPTAYVASRQDHWRFANFVVRSNGDPRALEAAVKRELRAVDPAMAVAEVRTMGDVVAADLAGRRLPMLLMTAFALLALTLAAVGVYGVVAYSVASRTREFGVRMALGARRGDVLRLVLGQGALSALAGVALGLAAAAAGTRMLAGLLYGVRPLDGLTFGAAAATIAVAALGASWLPARRATRVDPASALRSE